MSWTMNCQIPKGSTSEQAHDIIHSMVPSGNNDCPIEREKASNNAKAAISGLVNHAMGDYTSDAGFDVRVTGHCNPENKPRDGWSDDFIDIHVRQTDEK